MRKLLFTILCVLSFGVFASPDSYTPITIVKSGSATEDYYAQGSGFFINEKGYIATAAHVVEDVDRVMVLYKNKPFKADIVAVDFKNDVAIIKLRNLKEYTPFFTLANPSFYQKLVIVGFPAISEYGLFAHVTNAIVLPKADQTVFEMKGRACHGNSGGPVLDLDGNAVGVLVLGYFDDNIDNGLCSYHSGANYLYHLINLAKKANVPTYKSTVPTSNTYSQLFLYNMIRDVVNNEKVVFIQVHIKNK